MSDNIYNLLEDESQLIEQANGWFGSLSQIEEPELDDLTKQVVSRSLETYEYTNLETGQKIISPSTNFYEYFEKSTVEKRLKTVNRNRPPYNQLKTDDQIRKFWETKTNQVIKNGLAFHNVLDLTFKSGLQQIKDPLIERKYKLFLEWWPKFLKKNPKWRPYRSEWTIYDPNSNRCGTVDFAMVHQDDPDLLMIIDWKSVDKITNHNPFLFGSGPFQNYSHSNKVKFSFSMNYYREILTRAYHKKVTQMLIINFNPSKNKVTVIPCLDFSQEMDLIWN